MPGNLTGEWQGPFISQGERIPYYLGSLTVSRLILAHHSSLLRKIVRVILCSILEFLLPPGFV